MPLALTVLCLPYSLYGGQRNGSSQEWRVDPKTFAMTEKDAVNKIEGIFLFCLTWSHPLSLQN